MIDWQQIFDDLKSNGFSLRRITIETNIATTTLHGVKSGGEIGTSKGIKIIKLWSDVTRQPFLSFPQYPDENCILYGNPNQ